MNADADQRRRDLIDLRNQGERLAGQAETMLKEYKEKIPTTEREMLEAASREMRATLTSEDPDILRTAFQNLENASRSAGEAIYRESSASQPSAEEGSEESEAE